MYTRIAHCIEYIKNSMGINDHTDFCSRNEDI